MGLADELAGARVCVDTAPFIYFIEKSQKYTGILRPLFAGIASGTIETITSTISLLEVLVHPYRKGEVALAKKYRQLLLFSNGLTTFEVTHDIADRAAQLRATYGVRTPDAIQVAVALQYGADVLLTNDNSLRRISEIKVVILDDQSK